jgi:septum site-determining protein MinC
MQMIGDTQLKVQIKGVKEGLLITLGEGAWPELLEQLIKHINEQSGFFKGAKVALDVGNHIIHAAEMGALRDKLSDKGIMLWAILSNSPTTEQTAQVLGLATRLSAPRAERLVKRLDTNLDGENGILLQRTLRSGFKVASTGHVTVIGDVNPGAEIVAEGSVVVWGRLKGIVQAGSAGNEQATICALEMMPMQMRIANVDAVLSPKKGKILPEIARINQGRITIDVWNIKEGGK